LFGDETEFGDMNLRFSPDCSGYPFFAELILRLEMRFRKKRYERKAGLNLIARDEDVLQKQELGIRETPPIH